MKDIPSHIKIGKTTYCVIFTRHLDESVVGLCDDKRKYLVVSAKDGKKEILATLLHECLHAIEKEYKVKLGHEKINKLEYALAQVFQQLL